MNNLGWEIIEWLFEHIAPWVILAILFFIASAFVGMMIAILGGVR